jgi:hypothetical protein
MLRWIVNLMVTSALKTVQDRAVGHITVVELDVTYVVPVAVNYSYCTPDNGYGKYPKHVE